MSPPSPFLLEHRERLRAAARLGPVVDVACGRGRHVRAAAGLGAFAIGIDRSEDALAELSATIRTEGLRAAALRADVETGHGLPLRPESCGALLVFRFLNRPLLPALARALAPGGLLLYETFTIHQRSRPYGPSNPDFLLQPGELARAFPELDTLAVWEGDTPGPRPHAMARLAARKRG